LRREKERERERKRERKREKEREKGCRGRDSNFSLKFLPRKQKGMGELTYEGLPM
jgi:hypothetical protein